LATLSADKKKNYTLNNRNQSNFVSFAKNHDFW
jgi:hypothetical protein